MTTSTAQHQEVLSAVAGSVGPRGAFARIESLADRIRCHAKDCPEPAWYALASTPAGLRVRFATPDRWLRGKVPTVKHFRDDAKLYTFENLLPSADGVPMAQLAEKFLLAYEAAFRSLGDVGGGDEE